MEGCLQEALRIYRSASMHSLPLLEKGDTSKEIAPNPAFVTRAMNSYLRDVISSYSVFKKRCNLSKVASKYSCE